MASQRTGRPGKQNRGSGWTFFWDVAEERKKAGIEGRGVEEGEQDQACLEPANHTVLAIHPLSVGHQARFQDQGMGAGGNAECSGPDLVSRAFYMREGKPHNKSPAQDLLYTKTQCVPSYCRGGICPDRARSMLRD